ncbi:MAG: nucleotidyl transferase AbiEii/AbiGii toxin family protein [Actinomycetota bacterium]
MIVSKSFSELIFRGGTALARVYWPDFRLSEDLDFISQGQIDNLEARLELTVAESSKRIERSLKLLFGPPKGGWSRSAVESEFGELLIDINLQEKAFLPVEEEKIHLPYSDLDDEVRVRCISVAEILGNKWFMLDDRREPRDLYDLWAALTRFGVSFEEVVRGHQAKYGYPPLRASMNAAKQLQEEWETRLHPQLSDLPSLDKVISDVESIFESWDASSKRDG